MSSPHVDRAQRHIFEPLKPAPRVKIAHKLLENDIEAYLVKRVKELGGEVRKVQWVGRRNAPDRRVMIPERQVGQRSAARLDGSRRVWIAKKPPLLVWVELKNPETVKTFPANAHERAQHREHERMRRCGEKVVVIGTIEQVEELLG